MNAEGEKMWNEAKAEFQSDLPIICKEKEYANLCHAC